MSWFDEIKVKYMIDWTFSPSTQNFEKKSYPDTHGVIYKQQSMKQAKNNST